MVGAGPSPYPNNFQVATFEHYRFPAMPRGTAQCAKCHGDASVAWLAPVDRDHPTQQLAPVLGWRIVCGACHDKAADLAHFEDEVSPAGLDVCADCHGPGSDVLPVDLAHRR